MAEARSFNDYIAPIPAVEKCINFEENTSLPNTFYPLVFYGMIKMQNLYLLLRRVLDGLVQLYT